MPIENSASPTKAPAKGGVSLNAGSIAPLSESAMLVTLKVTGWTARKKDKRVTDEVNAANHVAKDAGAYWKSLLDKSAVNKVRAAAQAAREVHYKNTLAWDDEGARILPSRNFMRYRKEMREVRQRWDKAREEFLAQYPTLIEQARESLNGLFSEADYPEVETLGSKFSWEQLTRPVPDANDFRVKVADGERDRIKAELKEAQEAWMAKSSGDLWRRLYEVVERFTNAVGNKDQKVYRASLVGSMTELCGILPDLNLSGDRKLEEMRQEVEKKLCKRPAGEYRGKEAAPIREEAHDAAAGILSVIRGYTG